MGLDIPSKKSGWSNNGQKVSDPGCTKKRKRLRYRLVLLAVILLLFPVQYQCADSSFAEVFLIVRERNDSEKIRKVVEGLIAADNDRDLEKVLSFYSNDVTFFPPKEFKIVGKDAIRPRYLRLFKNLKVEITTTIDEIRVAGDLAYVSGQNAVSLQPEAGTAEQSSVDTYLMILRKQKAGGWLISRLMWHSIA